MDLDVIDRGARGLCLRGSLAGAEVTFGLERGPNLVGSDPSNQIALAHEGVSRRHALLVLAGGRVEVADQGSKNGTFLNGRRIRMSRVEPGDRLAFGPVELGLEEAPAADLELAVRLDAGGGRWLRGDTATDVLLPAAERWLRLVRRFVEQLVAAPAGGTAPALAVVMEELAAAGACLAELDGDAGVLVHGACGEVDPSCLDAAFRGWREAAREPFFRSGRELTLLVAATGRAPLGLLATGSFPERHAVQPLFATLLELFDHLGPGALPGPAPRAPTVHGLSFPPGHVAGLSPVMTAFYGQLRQLAASDLPLLIQGETGSGKELVARTLHLSSQRGGGPFVAINCAAIPSELLEAELFGIRRGVATGVEARPGRFQQAAGGTLLLDEIGEMPLTHQAKLLRALQEKEITPVGGAPQAMDARVLAATNADLQQRIAAGSFRRDLFYRLAGFVLEVPPLRERSADLPLLVDHLLRRFSAEMARPLRGMTLAALRILGAYTWPGNVRELEHELRRLVALCPPGQAIPARAISEHIRRAADPQGMTADSPPALQESLSAPAAALPTLRLSDLEGEAVRQALRRCDGNRAAAARLLGISRYSLLRRLRHLDR